VKPPADVGGSAAGVVFDELFELDEHPPSTRAAIMQSTATDFTARRINESVDSVPGG
jgi:hypothetical protein